LDIADEKDCRVQQIMVEARKLRQAPGMAIILSQWILKLEPLAEELLCLCLLLRSSENPSIDVFRFDHKQPVD
jgi:hypothetical protein